MRLRIGGRVERTTCEGPGARFALWVQGCRIRCAGCCNPQLFAARGGQRVTTDALAERLRALAGELEGVTFLGGEPFDQAEPLAELARAAQSLGLSVMVFSGYALEELRTRPEARALLAATDLLVDGPYDRTRPETQRRWVGSTNQRFHFLTARYRSGIECVVVREVGVEIAPDGTVRLHGWPELLGASRGRASALPRGSLLVEDSCETHSSGQMPGPARE
ncbi:MAG TPA: 4Fe-4S single cluster domain-containing protein [Myxococcota bacterium]|nr:4Fe-4S single cluster domain-containing protein [Myxococcota bacterium]